MAAPDKALEIKAFMTAILAFLTALWGWIGWAVWLMVAAMALDYITGTVAAKARGEWTSAAAREGLWHKLGEIVALLVAALCDKAIAVILHTDAAAHFSNVQYGNYLTLVVALWYLFTEVGSILENIKKLGAPIPDWLITGAKTLKGQVEKAAPLGQDGVEIYHGAHEREPEDKPPDEQPTAAEIRESWDALNAMIDEQGKGPEQRT